MKKYISVLLLAAFCLGLTACGVKGPLYYPEQNNQQSTTK